MALLTRQGFRYNASDFRKVVTTPDFAMDVLFLYLPGEIDPGSPFVGVFSPLPTASRPSIRKP